MGIAYEHLITTSEDVFATAENANAFHMHAFGPSSTHAEKFDWRRERADITDVNP
jgi:hypothetical protein